jgi:hypothetical protein
MSNLTIRAQRRSKTGRWSAWLGGRLLNPLRGL